MDIGRQYGQRFGLLHHTHKPQKRPYPICANRSRNVWHPCWRRLSRTHAVSCAYRNLFRGVDYLKFFRLVLPFISEQLKSLPWPPTSFRLRYCTLFLAMPFQESVWCFGDESTESRSALQLFSIPPHFCFCRQMNAWASEREGRGCLAPPWILKLLAKKCIFFNFEG